LSAPASYLTDYRGVCDYLGKLKRADVREFARSAGGRPLHAVSFGAFEPVERRANLSSALAAGRPEAFYGPGRTKRVLQIHSAIHGAEMESIAGVINLISVLETGKDLDGVAWPRLSEYAQRLRIVIVPVANPDGRARLGSNDPVGWSEYQQEKYRHGLNAEGGYITWPACKIPHPRNPKEDSFLGGYFNDAGVNPLHGIFLDRSTAPESHGLAELAAREVPDCFIDLHSCTSGPFFIIMCEFIPNRMVPRQSHYQGAWRTKMRGAGLPVNLGTSLSQQGDFHLDHYICQQCGAQPLLFEGGAGERYEGDNIHRQIIETYMLLFETLCEIGVLEGFR
jgi:hypothetical protein